VNEGSLDTSERPDALSIAIVNQFRGILADASLVEARTHEARQGLINAVEN
jgi:hypothetical protein